VSGAREPRALDVACGDGRDARWLPELGKAFNPAYVVERNELLRAFEALHVRHYREGVAGRRGEERGVASIVAQRLD